jgi:hypothetical protein
MKLGAAYNVFDGVELLEGSIKSIRDNVDFICVVFQEFSNFGNQLDRQSIQLFKDLVEKKVIDQIHYYKPVNNYPAGVNEIRKRNIGKGICNLERCTHFLTIDTDEYYLPSQFKAAKQMVYEMDMDSSACQMLTYYKEKDVILWPPEDYYVPFIYKVDDRLFKANTNWPASADPTRKLEFLKGQLFDREVIQMHHFSYVRNDIRQKLENSTAMVNWENRIPTIAEYHDNWVYPKPALLAGSKERYYDIMRVSQMF